MLNDPGLGSGRIVNVYPYPQGYISIVVDFANRRKIYRNDELGNGECLFGCDLAELPPNLRQEIVEPGYNESRIRSIEDQQAVARERFRKHQVVQHEELKRRSVEKWVGSLNLISSAEELQENPLVRRSITKLHNGKRLENEEVRDLEARSEFQILAEMYEIQFYEFRDPWDAIRACMWWRDAGYPERTIKLADSILEGHWPGYHSLGQLMAAAYTTKGGAYRDLKQYVLARELGERALATEDEESWHAHNLLGAIYFDQGNYRLGLEHFDRAGFLEKKTSSQYIEPVLRTYDSEAASRAARWLLSVDSRRYSWAKKYA